MNISKKIIMSAGSIAGGGYEGDAYYMRITAASNIRVACIRMDESTGYVALPMYKGSGFGYPLMALLDETGNDVWQKQLSDPNNMNRNDFGGVAFYGDSLYQIGRYTKSDWAVEKFSLSDGSFTNIGSMSFNDYRPTFAQHKMAIFNGYYYWGGWEPDDYIICSYGAIDWSARNQYGVQSPYVNIGTSIEACRGVSFTDLGSGTGYATITGHTGTLGDQGWVVSLNLDNGNTPTNHVAVGIKNNGTGNNYDGGRCAVTDSSGNVYVQGQHRRAGGSNRWQTYFMKLNSSGAIQWVKEIWNATYDSAVAAETRLSAYICSQGNIHFSTWNYGSSGTNHNRYIYTLDSSGNYVSRTIVTFASNADPRYYVCDFANDGVVIAGETSTSRVAIDLVRFPLNEDVSFTDSNLTISYSTSETFSATGTNSNYVITTLSSGFNFNQTGLDGAKSVTVSNATDTYGSPTNIPY